VLKANVRGRILSLSNWGLCHCFPLQSDSPDDGSGWHRAHRWEEEARPPTAAETCRRLCCVAAPERRTKSYGAVSPAAWRYWPRSASPHPSLATSPLIAAQAHPLATVVWPGVRLSNALVSEECVQLHAVGRGYDEAQDCQFLSDFLAVGLCTGSCAGVTTGADRTTVTPVYVCA